eukprot:15454499-Alexandrium_andersonii.AAC.1
MLCVPWPGGAAGGWCWVPGAYMYTEGMQLQQMQQWEWGGGEDRMHGEENREMKNGDESDGDEIQERLLRELRQDGPRPYWPPCWWTERALEGMQQQLRQM